MLVADTRRQFNPYFFAVDITAEIKQMSLYGHILHIGIHSWTPADIDHGSINLAVTLNGNAGRINARSGQDKFRMERAHIGCGKSYGTPELTSGNHLTLQPAWSPEQRASFFNLPGCNEPAYDRRANLRPGHLGGQHYLYAYLPANPVIVSKPMRAIRTEMMVETDQKGAHTVSVA